MLRLIFAPFRAGLTSKNAMIIFLSVYHQAEPGRISRPVSGLFFCLTSRDWGGIYSVAAIHQAKPFSGLHVKEGANAVALCQLQAAAVQL